MEEMLKQVDELNTKDLVILNKYIVSRLKMERTQRERRSAILLVKGDRVYFKDKNNRRHNCVVEKVNRTTINVRCRCDRCNSANINAWKVSASMLKKRDELGDEE